MERKPRIKLLSIKQEEDNLLCDEITSALTRLAGLAKLNAVVVGDSAYADQEEVIAGGLVHVVASYWAEWDDVTFVIRSQRGEDDKFGMNIARSHDIPTLARVIVDAWGIDSARVREHRGC